MLFESCCFFFFFGHLTSHPVMHNLFMITFVLQSRSPLWIASIIGRLEVVKTLIKAGANVNQADEVCVYAVSFILLPLSIILRTSP